MRILRLRLRMTPPLTLTGGIFSPRCGQRSPCRCVPGGSQAMHLPKALREVRGGSSGGCGYAMGPAADRHLSSVAISHRVDRADGHHLSYLFGTRMLRHALAPLTSA